MNITEREFDTETRRRLAKEGKAKSDGSYPIENEEDLGNAVQAWGRGGATASDKAWIKKRAAALGATDKLPDDWKDGDSTKEAGNPKDRWDPDHDGDDDSTPKGDTDHDYWDKAGNQKKSVPGHPVRRGNHARSKDDDEDEQKEAGPPPWVDKKSGKGDDDEEEEEEKDLKADRKKESSETIRVDGLQLLEADATGSECEFILIQSGTSKNGYHYSAKTLQEAVPLFIGVDSFSDHTNEQEQRYRPERSVKDKVGRWTEAHYGTATVKGQVVEGIIGHLKVIAPWMRELLRESMKMGEPDFVGVSIDAMGRSVPKVLGGRRVKEVEKIQKVFSVDVVTTPSAGGRLMRLVASDGEGRRTLDDEQVATMTPADLTSTVREVVAQVLKEAVLPLGSALKEQQDAVLRLQEATRVQTNTTRYEAAIGAAGGLSEMGQSQLRTRFKEAADRRDLSDDEILSSIRESVQYEARLMEHYSGMVGPRSTPRAHVGMTEYNKHYQALIGMFENQDQTIEGRIIPKYRSIKEAYCRWTNRDSFEVDPMEIQRAFSTTYDSAYDHTRMQESVNTATWGQVYADVLYLMLIKAYRVNPVYNKWRAIVSDIENVPDFQQRHWTRLGGYNDLTTVPESATYQPMISSTNEQVSYAVAKRGGLDDVTFEAIANDRVGAIRRIPIAMARAAARTLYKFVFQLVTISQPTMSYDGVALYNASHGNGPNANALSLTGIQSAITAMRLQTAFSETQEILGERNKPKIFMVPTQLEFVAQRLLQPSDAYLAAIANPSTEQSLDPQAFKGLGMDYVVLDFLTSATGWYAVADPGEVATFVLGFLNGKEDPELFVQDQPNVGSNFTADKVTYKVRHIYGGVVEDHRSFYQGNA